MAIDLTRLTTRPECDEAVESLEAELDSYQHQDNNISYGERQAGRSSADVQGRLIGVNAEIASYSATLAQADLPAKLRKQTESKLRRAHDRKDNLTERGEARTGALAFLATVDATQNEAQVTILRDAIDQVARHRATLPA